MRDFAPIYAFMCRNFGVLPRDVDEMELWEIHVCLYPDGAPDPQDIAEDRLLTREEFEAEARRLLKQRFRSANGEGGPPSIADQ